MAYKIKPTLFIGLGGIGGHIAELVRLRLIKTICSRFANNAEQVEVLEKAMKQFYRMLWFDSGEKEDVSLTSKFSGVEEEVICAPLNYRELEVYSGEEILKKLEEKPFEYLKSWVEKRKEFIREKEAGAEAEGIRLYGAINALINIGFIRQQLYPEIEYLANFEKELAKQKMIEFGLPIDTNSFTIEIFGSSAGGQGSGLWLILLCLLANKSAPKSNLHIACQGFHGEQNEALTQAQNFKTLAVLRDLARAKSKQGSLEFPLPEGEIKISAAEISKLINTVNLYLPPTYNYKEFISYIANSMVAGKLTSFAGDLRQVKSNTIADARVIRQFSKKAA